MKRYLIGIYPVATFLQAVKLANLYKLIDISRHGKISKDADCIVNSVQNKANRNAKHAVNNNIRLQYVQRKQE